MLGLPLAASSSKSYTWRVAMTAEEILVHMRAVPVSERLRVVEHVVREVADATRTLALEGVSAERDPFAIFADVPDAEYEAYVEAVQRARRDDVLRSGE